MQDTQNNQTQAQEPTEYDPFLCPGNIELAKMHKIANHVHAGNRSNKSCPCCGAFCEVDQFDIKTEVDQLSYVGIAYYFFFKFLQFQILVLLFSFCLVGIYQSVKIPRMYTCLFFQCNKIELEEFQTQYAENNLNIKLLCIINLVIITGFKLVFAYKMKTEEREADKEFITVNDYTIYASGLHIDDTEESIKILFDKLYGSEIVVKVNLIYNIRELQDLIDELMEKKRYQKKVQVKYPDQIEKIKLLDTEIKELGKQIETKNLDIKQNRKTYFTRKAFITFQTVDAMAEFSDNEIRTDNLPIELTQKWFTIKCARATQPNDVIWTNFGLTWSQKQCRRITTVIAAIVLIIACYWAVTGMTLWQQYYEENNPSKFVIFYSLLISIVIAVLNFLLRKALIFFSNIERRPLYTFYQFSLIWKITIATFLNSALVILFVNYYYDRNFEPLSVYQIKGTANKMIVVMILSVFLNAILVIFDPLYLYSLLKKKLIYKKLEDETKKQTVFQYQLNEAEEGFEFNLADILIMNLKTFAIGFFYAAVLPIGVLISLIEIILVYFAVKWTLVYRARTPKDLQFVFCQYILVFLEFLFIFYSLGHLTFDKIILDKIPFETWTLFIVNVLSVTLFNSSFIFRFFKDRLTYEDQKTFEECDFPTDFDRLNPMTSRHAVKKWIYQRNGIDFNDDDEDDNIVQNLLDANTAEKMKIFKKNEIKVGKLARQSIMSLNSANNVEVKKADPLKGINFYELERKAKQSMKNQKAEYLLKKKEKKKRKKKKKKDKKKDKEEKNEFQTNLFNDEFKYLLDKMNHEKDKDSQKHIQGSVQDLLEKEIFNTNYKKNQDDSSSSSDEEQDKNIEQQKTNWQKLDLEQETLQNDDKKKKDKKKSKKKNKKDDSSDSD